MTDYDTQTATPSICHRIVRNVASTNGVEPTELEPLYHTVDPEHLEGVLADGTLDDETLPGKVAFPYEGCYVEITGDGTVEVRRLEAKAGQGPNPTAGESPSADPEAPD